MDACGSLANIYLVTLLFRDGFRCWLPAAQFWISKEHGDLYVQALKTLQDWTGQRWHPSAFLIHGSSIEARAIGQCFHSSRILRCTRHSTQTLKSKLSHIDDLMYLMERAIFAETQAECHRYIQECLEKCPYAELRRYVLTAWNVESSHIWSLHSRLDTPILREITTINACESYHSLVRQCTNRRMDMKECTVQIIQLIGRRYDSACEVHLENESRITRAAFHVYPEPASWTLPYQRLVSPEITMAERMIADGSWRFQWFQAQSDCTCCCKFFRTNRLPCKHIFVKDLNSNKSWLTQTNWDRWAMMTANGAKENL
ncbi:hypothetical protein EDD86DRAFT_80962 [Gorgonomyces haynaldii]|nr:hypothetical protein EDD86DRAFT_80878 [Gorgonomyces haynaldii]KAI8914173.1 hypothetical protein EDD86DRAFT_80962 [Gorgonomyces haynaldii]